MNNIKTFDSNSMIKKILLLAIPAALKNLLDMLQVLIDLFMVGSLGINSLAAVGLGLQFLMMLGVVMSVFSVGGNAVLSRLKGSSRINRANKVLYNLFLFTVVLSLISTLFLVPLTPFLYSLMGASDEVVKLGDMYFGTLAYGLVLIFLDVLFFTYFSSMGNTIVSLYIKIFSASINVLLNYMFIFGNFGAPALGVQGAAIATLIALGINVLLYLLMFLGKNSYGFIYTYSTDIIKTVLKVGVPASIERGISMISFMFFVGLIASYSTQALAAYQVGLRIEGIAFMPGFGFSIAAMTLVGQYIGANQIDLAEKSALFTAKLASVFMGLVGILMIFYPEFAIKLFTDDEDTISQAVIYLQMVGITQVPLAVMFVLSSALRGAGAVKTTLLISLSTLWTIRIIPSYVASYFGGDIIWVYSMMALETLVKGLIFYFVFKKGSWKTLKVKT